MKEIVSKLKSLDANHYRIIILLQLAIIVLLLNTVLLSANSIKTVAQGSTTLQGLETDAKACLSLPQDERGECARLVGRMVALQTSDSKERLRACQVFRPHYYEYDCQKGLSETE